MLKILNNDKFTTAQNRHFLVSLKIPILNTLSKGAPLFYWSVACSFIQSTKLVETDSGAGTSGRRNTLLMSPLTESNALMPAGFPGALSSLKSGLK